LDFNCNSINAKTVELKWRTASESNSSYFAVERSEDAINYELVGKVNAAGNSVTTKQYSLIDEDASSELLYYRLKSVDMDQSYKYSSICSVTNQMDDSNEMTVYPNPTNGSITIGFKNNTPINFESYSLMDITGKKS